MTTVESSMIMAIGYDEDSMDVYVEFLGSGRTYVYSNVESWVYEEFLNAGSVGIYFNQHIRDSYQYNEM